MKKFITLLPLLVIVVDLNAQTYCAPTYSSGCSGHYWSSFVTTGAAKNISDATGCTATAYVYDSTDTIAAHLGSTVNYTFINSSFKQGYEIWADWNTDGNFTDSGENIYSSPGNVGAFGTVVGSFTIPSGATAGYTGLRLECAANAIANTDTGYGSTPCATHVAGNAKDYVLLMLPNGNCDSITKQPKGLTSCSTNGVSFSVAAMTNGFGSLSYQWLKDGMPIAGATDSSYSITSLSVSDSGNYTAVVTNASAGCGVNDTSNIAHLVVIDAAILLTPSGVVTACFGNSVHVASASGASSYQWLDNGSVIPGATTSSYNASATGNYSLIGNFGICSAPSDTANITIEPYVFPNVSLFDFTLSTDVWAAYQWYRNGVAIPGANAQTYNVTSNGTYYVQVVSSTGCTGNSVNTEISDYGLSVASVSPEGLLSIFPNPTSGSFTIRGDIDNANAGDNVTISIIDNVGRLVWSDHFLFEGGSINHSVTLPAAMPAGTYILIVGNSGGRAITHFTKLK